MCVYVCIYIYIYIYTHTHTHTHTHTFSYVFQKNTCFVCVCVHVYIYIYTHTHTHTHTIYMHILGKQTIFCMLWIAINRLTELISVTKSMSIWNVLLVYIMDFIVLLAKASLVLLLNLCPSSHIKLIKWLFKFIIKRIVHPKMCVFLWFYG